MINLSNPRRLKAKVQIEMNMERCKGAKWSAGNRFVPKWTAPPSEAPLCSCKGPLLSVRRIALPNLAYRDGSRQSWFSVIRWSGKLAASTIMVTVMGFLPPPISFSWKRYRLPFSLPVVVSIYLIYFLFELFILSHLFVLFELFIYVVKEWKRDFLFSFELILTTVSVMVKGVGVENFNLSNFHLWFRVLKHDSAANSGVVWISR